MCVCVCSPFHLRNAPETISGLKIQNVLGGEAFSILPFHLRNAPETISEGLKIQNCLGGGCLYFTIIIIYTSFELRGVRTGGNHVHLHRNQLEKSELEIRNQIARQ